MNKKECFICHKSFTPKDINSADIISEYISDEIKKEHANWSQEDFICDLDLNKYRSQHIRNLLKEDDGEISKLESEVLKSMQDHELIANDINHEFESKLTFGEKIADKVAEFGGSWMFIIIFSVIILVWITINATQIFAKSFDPYPFILLNLVLSCLAALQAPVIMMSQNRQQAKDRLTAEMDYKINLKAELEIRHLKAKIDQLADHQWRRLLEIQALQTSLIEDLSKLKKS